MCTEKTMLILIYAALILLGFVYITNMGLGSCFYDDQFEACTHEQRRADELMMDGHRVELSANIKK